MNDREGVTNDEEWRDIGVDGDVEDEVDFKVIDASITQWTKWVCGGDAEDIDNMVDTLVSTIGEAVISQYTSRPFYTTADEVNNVEQFMNTFAISAAVATREVMYQLRRKTNDENAEVTKWCDDHGHHVSLVTEADGATAFYQCQCDWRSSVVTPDTYTERYDEFMKHKWSVRRA